jgi:hypothetical protein
MRGRRVDGLNGHPVMADWSLLHGREDNRYRDIPSGRCGLGDDAMEPGDMRDPVRRELRIIVVVRREMLMDLSMRVMCIGVVPMLEWQGRRERETWREQKSDDSRPHTHAS